MKPVDFGDFILLEHMGHGGMASVYRASRRDSGEIVAIKIFKESEDRPIDVVRRLRDREVRMMLAIQHPHVVRFIEAGDFSDKYYYTMEFVDFSLLKLMKSATALSLAQKINLLLQTTSGLKAIHNQCIVHRDIKPGNILLSPEDASAPEADRKYAVKITDLGIAKNVSETDVVTTVSSKKIPGTPKYLSPEQIELKPVDGRADIFSLGVVAYELLSGDTPFSATTSDEYMKANVEQQAKPLHEVNPEVPPFVSDIVSKMLAKDREVRYDSDTLERDLTLVEEHMKSGAALLEQTNPNSIFYVPPPPSAEHVVRHRRKRAAPAPAGWVGLAAVALVAVGLASARWPEAPQLPPPVHLPDAAALPARPAEEVLARAAEEAGAPQGAAHALALLEGLKPEELTPDQRTRRSALISKLSSALAEPVAKTALALLEQDRDPLAADRLQEVEVYLEYLRRAYPGCPQIEQVDAALKARKAERQSLSGVQEAKVRSDRMVRAGQYAEAAAEWFGFLDAGQPAPAAKGAARELAAIMAKWFDSLRKTRLSADSIKPYLDLQRTIQTKPWKTAVPDRSASLLLALGDQLREEGRLPAAQAAFEEAIRLSPESDDGRTARLRLEAIRLDLRTRPIPPLVFVRQVAREGYKADFWEKHAPAGGGIEAAQDRVELSVKGGENKARAELAMGRYADNAGLELSFPLQVKLPGAQPGQTEFQAGIEVRDEEDSMVRVYVDRYGYRAEQYLKGAPVGAKYIILPLATDALAEAHVVKFRYSFIDKKCEIHVDGKKKREFTLPLSRVKVHLFADIQGPGTLKADFGKLTCVTVE